jgi:hypothetical protein
MLDSGECLHRILLWRNETKPIYHTPRLAIYVLCITPYALRITSYASTWYTSRITKPY